MSRLVTGLLLTAALLLGCATESKTLVLKNEKYGFTVTYPASWRVNDPPAAPPPPASTNFSRDGAVVSIVAWEGEPNRDEQESLRKEGWAEETVTVAGEKGTLFSRPPSDTQPGLWKRLYFQHEGVAYEISLEVTDKDRAQDGLRVFDDIVRSFTWTD